ncbi:MAG: hypothetical protein K2Z81_19210 [Cyanobacteria bacterium]|nr:hypothetical protein [Cyanobacteriota bacterium]
MKTTFPLLLGAAIVLSIGSALQASAADPVTCSVQRFACVGSTRLDFSKYEPLEGGDGLGPSNYFVNVDIPFASTPVERLGGYTCQAVGLEPPSATNGFQSFQLTLKKGSNGLANSSLEFYFRTADQLRIRVRKPFSQIFSITPPDARGFQTLTLLPAQLNSPTLDTSKANLEKFIVILSSTRLGAQMYFGDFKVKSGQGNYTVSVLKFDQGACPP